MAKIFVVSNDEEFSSEHREIFSHKESSGQKKHYKKENPEQVFSFSELLANEYEQEASTTKEISLSSKNNNILNRYRDQALRIHHNKSELMREEAIDAFKIKHRISGSDGFNQITSLECERILHQGNFRIRKKVFQSIILNRPDQSPWLKDLLHTLTITFVAFLFTIPLSIVPAHDLVKNPEFWYELIYHGMLSTTLGFIFQCVRASYFLNISHIRRIRNVLSICLAGNCASVFFLIGTYHIWTTLFGFYYPIPLLGIIATYSFRVLYCVAEWFSFPKMWRRNEKLRKQMKFFLMYMVFTIMTNILYNITIIIVSKSSHQNQPFVSLALPLEREIFLWLSTYLVKKSANGDPDAASIMLKYLISITHTVSLCYVVSIVTNTTSWVLMTVDFVINMSICLRIVWMKKFSPLLVRKQIILLQDLALYELAEFHAPLSFIFVFVSAYFGPNAELFGNISNSYWTYKAVEDIHHTLKNMAVLFIVDFSSTIFSSLILWRSCQINLYKVFVVIQKEFGTAFSALLGYILLVVCIILIPSNFQIIIKINSYFLDCLIVRSLLPIFQFLNKNLISWGIDFTGKFDWIDGQWNATIEGK